MDCFILFKFLGRYCRTGNVGIHEICADCENIIHENYNYYSTYSDKCSTTLGMHALPVWKLDTVGVVIYADQKLMLSC